MHRLKNYEKYRLNYPQINLILTQMGFFSDLKRKNIRFNPQAFSKRKNKKENNIDFHIDVTRKIDEVITRNKENQQLTDNKKITTPEFIEFREPFTRTPTTPTFQTQLGQNTDFGELENIQEFVEIDPPTNFLMEKQPEKKEEFESWMVNNQNEKDQKTFWGLGSLKIRIRGKEPQKTTTNKNNETTLAKIELEETQKEIERKKKELEEAIKKQKEKELKVKKEEEEKRKQEKLKKIELKKKQKEEKIRQKLAKKAQIEKEREIKKLESEREKELKKAQLEKEKELKKKELELKKQELELMKQELIKGKEPEPEPEQEPESEPEQKVVEKEELPEEITDIIEEKKEYTPKNLNLDEDVAKLLPIIDSLFEKLPEEVVDEFTKSEYFELYEKVLLKYKNK